MGAIALEREQALWCKTSGTGQGVNVTNFVTANAVYPISDADFTQTANFIPNAEKRNSRSRLKPIIERYPPGSWGFTTYAKPASTAGSLPEAGALLLAAFGVETNRSNTRVTTTNSATNTVSKITVTAASGTNRVGTAVLIKKGTTDYEVAWITAQTTSTKCTNGTLLSISPELGTAPTTGVSVIGSRTYSLIATSPGDLGILKSEGHTTFRQTGCTVNTLTCNVNGDGIAEWEWGGEFMRQYITGTDEIATGGSIATAAVTNMKVAGSAWRFMAGSIIKIDDEVIGVSLDPAATAVATVRGLVRGIKSTVATAHATGADIDPWKPSSLGTSRGAPTPGYKGYLEIAGTKLQVKNCQITLNNGTEMATGEKDNSAYVTAFSNPEFREVTGTLTALFRKANVKHFQDAKQQVNLEVVIPVGDPDDGAGKLISIRAPQCNVEVPQISGSGEREENIPFTAFELDTGSQGELRLSVL